jgi:hypothetical protein
MNRLVILVALSTCAAYLAVSSGGAALVSPTPFFGLSASRDYAWNWAPNIQYSWGDTYTSDVSPLPAGTYELRMYVEGTLAQRGTCVVQ